MKARNVFPLLLLSIAIILGSFQIFGVVKDYFSQGEALAKSNSLEIEYWIDPSTEEVDIRPDSESILIQLRNKKIASNDSSIIDMEETENISGDTGEKKSFWDKLLETREKDKKVSQNPISAKSKKDKNNEDTKDKKAEEEITNRFDEIKDKSKEDTKNKVEKVQDKKDEKQNNQSTQEEQKKAIEKAKKEKERKEREQKEKDKKENIVTIHIRCDTAVAKGMADDPKWQGIVPKSGVILATTKFKIKDGDTVLDVLKMAQEQYKFHMSYRGNEASAYIEGINNLYEFDGGRWSGWMYCVNGWYPNYGAGVYTLKGGDVIEWNYTCDLGKDLGQEWLGE